MDPDPWLAGAAGAALLLLLIIAALSAVEAAVSTTRRLKLPKFANEVRVLEVEAVLDRPELFLSSARLGRSIAEALLYAAGALIALEATVLADGSDHSNTIRSVVLHAGPNILLSAVISYVVVAVVGEALPRSGAGRCPEALFVRSLGFIRLFTLVMTPIRWLARRLRHRLSLPTGVDLAQASRSAHSEEAIKQLVEGSAEEGVLEEDEREMIQSIFQFGDTVARQIMVPRIDISSVPADAPLDEVARQAMDSGHSRLPVYEGTLDNVVGVVHVKDLLPHLIENRRDLPVREVCREAYFVPEGKKIDELLQEFRRAKSQLAIVVDEFGGTGGLVTVEDVLEEIVGEIEDEYDTEEPTVEPAAAGEGTILDGRIAVEDVNELLGLNLSEDDYDTLGGFVFGLFGRPAQEGERVSHDGVDFVVEAMDGARFQRIRVTVPDQNQEARDEQPAG